MIEHWKLQFSIGAISQAQAKATTALADSYRQIGGYVRQQPVAHADKTGHFLTREPMCWIFLQDHRIPLDNNTAERAIRPYVIGRTLSFFSQSHHGDQFRPLILSIIGTAQRLEISNYPFIRSACGESMSGAHVPMRFQFNPPPLLTQC